MGWLMSDTYTIKNLNQDFTFILVPISKILEAD